MSPVALGATPAPRFEIRAVWLHLLLGAVSALLLGLAFPRPGWWPLAHVALVPMTVLAVRSAKAWTVAWTAYLVAWAWWLIRTQWLYQVTGGGYVALAAYMAVYTPLAMLLVRWLYRRYGAATVLTLPLAWVSFEFTRCNFLQGGFGWFALGHAQAPWKPEQGASYLIQVSDLFGQHAVSFLVCMTNGLFVDLLTRPIYKRDAIGRIDFNRHGAVVMLLWTLVYVTALVYGWYRVSQGDSVTGAAGRVSVAVVQTNVPQDNKNNPEPEQMMRDWTRMLELTIQAARSNPKPNLIVWPETMVPAAVNAEARMFFERTTDWRRGDEQFHRDIEGLTQVLGLPILVGAGADLDWRPMTFKGRTIEMPYERYNSAYLYEPIGGQSPQRYDKMHRVPFGEYLPWIENWPWLKRLFMKYLSPYGEYDYTIRAGDEFTVFTVRPPGSASPRPVRFATPICFEDSGPRVPRQMCYDPDGAKRCDLLVNLTNDGWYPRSDQPAQHFQIAVLRCVENRVPMARAVNTGFSGFIDSNGRVLRLVEVDGRNQVVEGWSAAELRLDPRKTLFGRAGSWPIVGMMIATALLALGGLVRRKNKAETPSKG
jgi:apolipoprotein N-acyltransferase